MVAKYLAMVSGAMFDAINAVDQQFESYLPGITPQAGASAIVAGSVLLTMWLLKYTTIKKLSIYG